jgi:glycosyltransferase involved in cell wall biosynthesis
MPKLSVIIPVYNEIKTVKQIIKEVNSVDLGNVTKELIVVDDCSIDGTRDILKKISGINLLLHKVNMGKGAAIQTALKHVTGDMIIIQDADLEYDPQDYPSIIKPILKESQRLCLVAGAWQKESTQKS